MWNQLKRLNIIAKLYIAPLNFAIIEYNSANDSKNTIQVLH